MNNITLGHSLTDWLYADMQVALGSIMKHLGDILIMEKWKPPPGNASPGVSLFLSVKKI
ncbi:MAG: hypothetical protein GX654_02790 [Desulfatiglans sp.]|nr:hypothetical protein [Desulfatiglans sp.]